MFRNKSYFTQGEDSSICRPQVLSRLNANGVLGSDFKLSKALPVTEVIFYVFEEYPDALSCT